MACSDLELARIDCSARGERDRVTESESERERERRSLLRGTGSILLAGCCCCGGCCISETLHLAFSEGTVSGPFDGAFSGATLRF